MYAQKGAARYQSVASHGLVAGASPTRLVQVMFEQILGYGNHLGLYSEETGMSGEALGNFPQAFTHLALISAAFTLNRVLDGGKPGS